VLLSVFVPCTDKGFVFVGEMLALKYSFSGLSYDDNYGILNRVKTVVQLLWCEQ